MYRRDDAIILFNITLNPAKILHLSPSSLSIALYPWHTPPRINSQSRSNDSKKGIYTLMPYVTECVLPFVRLIDDFPRRPAAAAYQRDGTFPRWVLLCPAGNHLSDGICRRLDENQSLYSRGIDVRLVTKRCCLIILPCVQVIFVNNPWHYPALL